MYPQPASAAYCSVKGAFFSYFLSEKKTCQKDPALQRNYEKKIKNYSKFATPTPKKKKKKKREITNLTNYA